MPQLLTEMRADVQNDSTGLVREFVLLPQRGGGVVHPKKRFEYFEPEHPELQLSVDWLVEMGAVTPVGSAGPFPIYRMLPDFAGHLRRGVVGAR